VTYSAARFHETSTTVAQLILGEGVFTGAPNIEQLAGSGTLNGQFIITFTGGTTHYQCISMTAAGDAAAWRKVRYPRGYGGSLPPELGVAPTQMELYLVSILPSGANTEEWQLESGTSFHFTPIVRVLKSSLTQGLAPSATHVDIVSRTSAGVEVDRLAGVELPLLPVSTDPNYLIYASVIRPVVFVDTQLTSGPFTSVFVIRGEVGGSAFIVPSTN
jgi:hypothetical protein